MYILVFAYLTRDILLHISSLCAREYKMKNTTYYIYYNSAVLIHIEFIRMSESSETSLYLPTNQATTASWQTSCALLHCHTCANPSSDMHDSVLVGTTGLHAVSPGYSWIRNLKCGICGEKWSICIDCSNVRKAFTSPQQVRRHYNRKHFLPLSSPDTNERNSRQRVEGAFSTPEDVRGGNGASRADEDDASLMLEASDNDVEDLVAATVHNDSDSGAHGGDDRNHISDVTFPFVGDRNIQYFTHNHQGRGVAYLVSRSQFGMDFLMDRLLQEDLSFQLHLASLISGMTRGQQRKFTEVMSKYHQVTALKSLEAAHRRLLNDEPTLTATTNSAASVVMSPVVAPTFDSTAGADRTWFSRMPTSFDDLRRLYVEGKTAFITNLPRPNVTRLQDHAYVSIVDCIADILAHGLDLDIIKAGSGEEDTTTNTNEGTPSSQAGVSSVTSQSKHCRSIYDRAQRILANQQDSATMANSSFNMQDKPPLICLWINEWSDGFEPSYSVKANRGSAWLKTITISPPANKVHSLDYTYPIAVGKSASSHEEVEKLFAAELQGLSGDLEYRLFYHGGLKRNVRVYAEVNVSLMDQPERRGSNYIMLGGGTYTSRWRHSADFSCLSSKIQACHDCLENVLRRNQIEIRPCINCTCWRTQNCGDILQFPVPAHFPPEMVPLSGTLLPMEITYKGLQDSAGMVHEKVLHGTWTPRAAKVFLRVQGMNSEAVNGITEHAVNCRKLNRAQPGSPEFVTLMEKKLKHPNKYLPWEIPSLWSRAVTLDQHVDVPMHLLFLGITKTVLSMVKEWTLGRRKEASFLRYANAAMLLPVRLGLDWCKAIPFGEGKWGGYVAENYLVVARLCGWLYSPIKLISTDSRKRRNCCQRCCIPAGNDISAYEQDN